MGKFLGRSTTGKIHMAIGPQAVYCSNSGQRRSIYALAIPVETAYKIQDSQFCKKCFGSKPHNYIDNLRAKGAIS